MRTRTASAAAVVVALLASLTPAASPAEPSHLATGRDVVRSYQGSNRHTGQVLGAGLPVELAERWRAGTFNTGSFPVVEDGVVFLSSSDSVSAFDLDTGRRLWLRTLSPRGVVGVDVGAGLVHVVTSTCVVLALDPATGDTRWVEKLWGHSDCKTPPVTRAGRTFVHTVLSPNTLFALDATTGATRWKRVVPNGGYVMPAVYGDRILVAGTEVKAYDLDGTSLWSSEGTSNQAVAEAVTIASGRVYVGSRVLDLDDGTEVGTVPSGYLRAIAGDTVVVVEGDETVSAYDRVSGEQAWSRTLPSIRGVAPLVVGDVVYVLSHEGVLRALLLEDGSEVWSADIDPTYAPPFHGLAVADGLLVVPAQGALRAFAPAAP